MNIRVICAPKRTMRTFIWCYLVGIEQIILFINIVDTQYEGDTCNHALKGVSGVCKRLDQCSDAIQELYFGRRPQDCSFANITPIVCCPSETTTITSITASTTISTAAKTPIGPLPVGEKSRLACESYKSLAYKMVNSSSLGDGNELVENCPWNHKSVGVNFDAKVAEEGEFPHMVLIGYGSMSVRYFCGGSLISEKYVLTAAHCLRSKNHIATRVRLGDLDYADIDDDEHAQDIKIKKVIVHPHYKHFLTKNDIALLELEHPAQLSLYVKPICLYRWDPTRKVHSGMVTGWGNIDNGTRNTRLLRGGVQYFTQEICSAEYITRNLYPEIHICFGPKEGSTVDTCKGDGGGPIQIYNKDAYCSYYTFGITSFGKTCGVSNTPTVYTKLYNYIEWIENIVWP